MLAFESPVLLQLEAGQLLNCTHAAPIRVRVVRGRVWVTQSNDLGDHFLEPGQAIRLCAHGQALLSADAPAEVRLEAEPGRTPARAAPPAYAAGAP